jgi:hypothetical protein
MGQLVEDLSLLAASTPCSISGLLLPPLWAAPKLRDKGLVSKMSLSSYCTPGQDMPVATLNHRVANSATELIWAHTSCLSHAPVALSCFLYFCMCSCLLRCLSLAFLLRPEQGFKWWGSAQICWLINWQCLGPVLGYLGAGVNVQGIEKEGRRSYGQWLRWLTLLKALKKMKTCFKFLFFCIRWTQKKIKPSAGP